MPKGGSERLSYNTTSYKAYASFAGTECDSSSDEPARAGRDQLDEGRIYVDRSVIVAQSEV